MSLTMVIRCVHILVRIVLFYICETVLLTDYSFIRSRRIRGLIPYVFPSLTYYSQRNGPNLTERRLVYCLFGVIYL